MKLLALALLAASAFAQSPTNICPQQAVYAGAGLNMAGTNSVSGVGAYLRRLACPGGFAVMSLSSVNVTGSAKSPAYTFSQGAAIQIANLNDQLSVYVGGDLGVAQSIIAGTTATPTLSLGTLTQFAKAGGVMVSARPPKFLKLPSNFNFGGAARYQTGNARMSYTFGMLYLFGEGR